MTTVVGPGLWPGDDFLRAQLEIFEDMSTAPSGITTYPFWAELPSRGPAASRMGRTLSMLDGMPVEIGPHGWKLADRPGMDVERAHHLLTSDLEALGIAGSGFDGGITLDLQGPWTLAAELYLARGDRVLTDYGAVEELSLALSEGIQHLLSKVEELLPGTTVTVNVHEHLIGQIAAGVLPTFSGYSRIPAVPGPELVKYLKPVLHAVKSRGARVAVTVGDAWVGIPAVVHSEADIVAMDFGRAPSWNERGWEMIAKAVERGASFWMGLPAPEVSQCAGPNIRALADALLVPWHRIGLEPRRLNDVAITQSAVAAQELYRKGSTAARGALSTLKATAEIIAERAAQ